MLFRGETRRREGAEQIDGQKSKKISGGIYIIVNMILGSTSPE